MYPLFESIKVVDGEICHWTLHRKRIYSSLNSIFGEEHILAAIERAFPDRPLHGLFKLRITYDHSHFQMEYIPYTIRKIRHLYLKHHDSITYDHKFSDRIIFNELTKSLQSEDDILIIKNGVLTDSSYSNVALFDGTRWFTPSNPLLKGIKRQVLLNQHTLTEKMIPQVEIRKYEKIALINAMIDLGELSLDINSIMTSPNSI